MEDLWGPATPDAYRIGAGQVTQDYPADACPRVCASSRACPRWPACPSLSPDEQVVTAEVAVVRRKASAVPGVGDRFSSLEGRCHGSAAKSCCARRCSRTAGGRGATSRSSPANTRTGTRRGCPLRGISTPALLFTATGIERPCALWARPHQRDGGQQSAIAEASSPCARGERARSSCRRCSLGVRRRLAVLARLNRGWTRRERPARHGQRHHGLVMFLLGFVSALLARRIGGWGSLRGTVHGCFRLRECCRFLPCSEVSMLAWPAMRPR